MLAAASEACPVGAPSRLAMPNGTAGSADAVPAAVLHKEAVYAAVGTGAYELHDFVDYQPWLRTTLVQASLFTILLCQVLAFTGCQCSCCSHVMHVVDSRCSSV